MMKLLLDISHFTNNDIATSMEKLQECITKPLACRTEVEKKSKMCTLQSIEDFLMESSSVFSGISVREQKLLHLPEQLFYLKWLTQVPVHAMRKTRLLITLNGMGGKSKYWQSSPIFLSFQVPYHLSRL